MKKIIIALIAAICLSLASCSGTQNTGNNGETYKVNFVTNGGSEVSPCETSELCEAPRTEREGYVFCGWYLDSELKNTASYPLNVNKDLTLYAKWIKATDSLSLEDATVQFSVDNELNYKAEYAITPRELDLQALSALGYKVKIEVTYEVFYEKDYDVAFDLGYMGAPDYDVAIVDLYDDGEEWTNLKTELEPKTNSVSTVVSASKLADANIRLKLMTYNLQNVVHFKGIKVNYSCMCDQ